MLSSGSGRNADGNRRRHPAGSGVQRGGDRQCLALVVQQEAMMNALRGAVGILMLEAVIYLMPPDHDPAFGALSLALKFFTVFALAALFWGGIAMFMWGVINQHSGKR
jgi:hypothetical protein